MTNLIWLLLICVILLFLLVLIIAGIVGLVHAIRTSVKKHRRPPLIAMIGWGISLLVIGLYVVISYVIPSYGLMLYFWGHMHTFWAVLVMCVAVALPIISTSFYIYDSYRLPVVSSRQAEVSSDGHSSTDSDDADDEEEDDEEAMEEQRIRNMQLHEAQQKSLLGRILTIAVCFCLAGSFVGTILYINYSLVASSTEEITEVQSPRDGRIIYVEKQRIKLNGYGGDYADMIGACTYERINALCVARLNLVRTPGDGLGSLVNIFPGNFTQEEISQIEWNEKGFRIPYEKQWIEYRFYGIEADDDT